MLDTSPFAGKQDLSRFAGAINDLLFETMTKRGYDAGYLRRLIRGNGDVWCLMAHRAQRLIEGVNYASNLRAIHAQDVGGAKIDVPLLKSVNSNDYYEVFRIIPSRYMTPWMMPLSTDVDDMDCYTYLVTEMYGGRETLYALELAAIRTAQRNGVDVGKLVVNGTATDVRERD